MKRIFCTVTTLLLLLSSFACQPTPERDIIVNKGDGSFERALFAESQEEWGSFSKEELIWKQDYNNNNLHINIDTKIEISDSREYPVIKVQNGAFTDEDMRKVLSLFITDPIGIREGAESKKLRAEDIEYIYGLELAAIPEDDKEWLDNHNEWKKRQLEEWVQLPDDAPFTPISALPTSLFGQYTIQSASGKDVVTQFNEQNLLVGYGQSMQDYYCEGLRYDWQPLDDCGISKESAINLTLEFLHNLGLDYLGVESCVRAQSIGADATPVYQVALSRGNGGIPLGYEWYGISYSLSLESENQYAPPLALGSSVCICE